MAKIRILLEVEADEPQDYQLNLTPAQTWLQNRDMLWMVHGQGTSLADECITLIEDPA